jgi:hypothetical protein
MRWLIFFLVLINFFVFMWFSASKGYVPQGSEENLAIDNKNIGAEALRLIADLPQEELLRRDNRKMPPPQSSSTTSASQRVELSDENVLLGEQCLMLGAFPEVVTAKQAKGRLEKKGMASRVVFVVKTLPAVNWVYIPPSASKKEALGILKKLQENSVESFVIGEGSYRNAISLGSYGSEDSANARMELFRRQGYDVRVAKRAREQKSYWLALGQVASRKMDKEMLASLQVEDNELKLQEKSCESIALLEAIE